MKIGPVETELSHVDGRTDRETDGKMERHDKAKSHIFFSILRTRLKSEQQC
jgi:hypothetical protein